MQLRVARSLIRLRVNLNRGGISPSWAFIIFAHRHTNTTLLIYTRICAYACSRAAICRRTPPATNKRSQTNHIFAGGLEGGRGEKEFRLRDHRYLAGGDSIQTYRSNLVIKSSFPRSAASPTSSMHTSMYLLHAVSSSRQAFFPKKPFSQSRPTGRNITTSQGQTGEKSKNNIQFGRAATKTRGLGSHPNHATERDGGHQQNTRVDVHA